MSWHVHVYMGSYHMCRRETCANLFARQRECEEAMCKGIFRFFHYVYVCMYVCMRLCVRLCVRVCVCVCVWVRILDKPVLQILCRE